MNNKSRIILYENKDEFDYSENNHVHIKFNRVAFIFFAHVLKLVTCIKSPTRTKAIDTPIATSRFLYSKICALWSCKGCHPLSY